MSIKWVLIFIDVEVPELFGFWGALGWSLAVTSIKVFFINFDCGESWFQSTFLVRINSMYIHIQYMTY